MTKDDIARHVNSICPNWKDSSGTDIVEDYLHYQRTKLIESATGYAEARYPDLAALELNKKAVYDDLLDLFKRIKSQPTIIEH